MSINYSALTTVVCSSPTSITIEEHGADGGTFIFYSDGTYRGTNPDFMNNGISEWQINDDKLFYRHKRGINDKWFHWDNPWSEFKTRDIIMNWMVESVILHE